VQCCEYLVDRSMAEIKTRTKLTSGNRCFTRPEDLVECSDRPRRIPPKANPPHACAWQNFAVKMPPSSNIREPAPKEERKGGSAGPWSQSGSQVLTTGAAFRVAV
jgi:hypothetical protein